MSLTRDSGGFSLAQASPSGADIVVDYSSIDEDFEKFLSCSFLFSE